MIKCRIIEKQFKTKVTQSFVTISGFSPGDRSIGFLERYTLTASCNLLGCMTPEVTPPLIKVSSRGSVFSSIVGVMDRGSRETPAGPNRILTATIGGEVSHVATAVS